jgi:very-short-patch-repair endonuclease
MTWHDLARRQSGVISRSQLSRAGLSEQQIDRRVRNRELVCVLPGVYAHRSVRVRGDERLWAAVLWSEGGVVSHHSAAAIWNVPAQLTTRVHLTVADRRFRKAMPNLRLHRVPLLGKDVTDAQGLPITSRTRTVIDLLRSDPIARGRTLLDRAIQLGWVTRADILASVVNGRGRTGNARLRQLCADLEPGAHAESERLLHRILKRAGVAGWVPQYRVRLGSRIAFVDVAFPAIRLEIEIDGKLYHDEFSDRFEDDRSRQNALIQAGWRILRFTWRQLNDEPGVVLGEILAITTRSRNFDLG